MTLLKAMATVGGFTMISRVAGLCRDILMATFLAVGPVADAFIVALRLPNFFRSVSAEGAFSVSFVPLYSKTIEKEGEDAAADFAGQALTVMAVFLSAFIAIMMVLMPYFIRLTAPGFDPNGETYSLAVEMTRITFPYLLLVSITALLGGILNANKRLGPFAAAPVCFNLTQIFMLLFAVQYFPTVGHALAWAVSISGLFQVAMMAFFLRRYKIKFNFQPFVISEKIKTLFLLMGPAVIGAGVYQINLFADVIIASTLHEGAVSYLYYADRFNQLPIGLIGAAVATALLPMMSRAMAAGRTEEARDLFNKSLEYCFILTLPTALALMAIPNRLISVIFEHGQFTATDTIITAWVLTGYAVGIPAYIGSKVYQSVLWSRQDTKTPVKISIITAICNVILSLILSRFIGVAGIALSTGSVAWLQLFLLKRNLRGDEVALRNERWKSSWPKIFLSSAIMMAVITFLSAQLYEMFLNTALPERIAGLAILVLSGALTYGVLIHLTGVLKLSDIKVFLKNKG